MITPFLLMGAMSPVSVAAALAQQVAEALAGIALVQTIRPGCPVVFGSFLSNTDMQSGSPSFGTPESAVGLLCTGQIARHYGLPLRAAAALTSSPDGRRAGGLRGGDDDAGRRSSPARTSSCTPPAGSSRASSPATRSSSSTSRSCGCCDARVPAARDQRGDARLLARTRRSAQGGHFLGAVHTLERFRECFYRPLLSSTENYERWIARRRQGRGRARDRDLRSRRSRSTRSPRSTPELKDELKAYVDRRRTELGD